MTGRRIPGVLWVVVLIVAAVATLIGVLVLYLGSVIFPPGHSSHEGRGGTSPLMNQVPFDLMLAGIVGIVAGVAGVAGVWRSRLSWRRLSVVSTVCGALAVLL